MQKGCFRDTNLFFDKMQIFTTTITTLSRAIGFTFQQHQVRNMQPLHGSYFGEGLQPPVARCVDPNAAQAFGVFGNISYVSHLSPLPAVAFGTGYMLGSKRACKRAKYVLVLSCLYAFFDLTFLRLWRCDTDMYFV